MEQKTNRKRFALTVFITAVITTLSVWVVLDFMERLPGEQMQSDAGGPVEMKNENLKEQKPIYWRAPMDPMEIYDAPGKSKMGMDLVPVYADEAAGSSTDGKRKIVYWKAPMDPAEIYEQPGKSRMGMDLVPVYADELVGGVDIQIDPVVEQNMGLKIETVEKGVLNHTIKTYGHITFDETRTGIVSQKAGGWVEKLYADYTGIFVEKGQPLYEIYSPALVASQEEYISAYKNYLRTGTPMNKDILASAKSRLSFFDIADPEIHFLETTQKVQKNLIVRSLFKGVITQKNVFEGSFVKPGASLFTISDLSHVWVEAHIFEYEQNLVFKGQEVEMTLSYKPGKIYKGEISYIYPYLQQRTRDLIVRIDFKNPNLELKPDMFAGIRIHTGTDKSGLSISSEAVIHTGERKIVFVADGGGKYSPREIHTGIYLDNGRVEILSGLAPGEAVVISGQFLLDSESKLREAIQKMIESKSAPAKPGSQDDFFDDMETGKEGSKDDDFFKDME